jgi:glycosyltransferase involved in cell wall biosynthesis
MSRVSIIIPTHDRPQMLKEAVESVFGQTFQDFEIIIVLNGASAESVAMGRELGRHPKIKVVEMTDSTLAASRNYGLSFVASEWVAFLDDDDIWLPEKLEVQLAAAESSGADLVSCDFTAFNKDGEIAGAGLEPLPNGLGFAEALMLDNFLSGGSAVLVKARAIRNRGGFDASLRGCEDWDMWRRLAWDGVFHHVDRPLVRYRRHGSNMTDRSELVLQAETQHFAKLLVDTPPHLHHILPAVQRRYFRLLLHTLTRKGSLDTYPVLLYNMLFSAYRILNKLTAGVPRKIYRAGRVAVRVVGMKRPAQRT